MSEKDSGSLLISGLSFPSGLCRHYCPHRAVLAPLKRYLRLPRRAGRTGQAFRSAELSEYARRARRTRAKGGAGTWMFHRHRSVRQTSEVKVPRSGARTASPGATPDGVIISRLTDKHCAINGDRHHSNRFSGLKKCLYQRFQHLLQLRSARLLPGERWRLVHII